MADVSCFLTATAYQATLGVPLLSGIRWGSGLVNPIWASQNRMGMRGWLAWANSLSVFFSQVLWLQGFAYSPLSNQRVSIAPPVPPPVLVPLVLPHQMLYKVFSTGVLGGWGPPLTDAELNPQ